MVGTPVSRMGAGMSHSYNHAQDNNIRFINRKVPREAAPKRFLPRDQKNVTTSCGRSRQWPGADVVSAPSSPKD